MNLLNTQNWKQEDIDKINNALKAREKFFSWDIKPKKINKSLKEAIKKQEKGKFL